MVNTKKSLSILNLIFFNFILIVAHTSAAPWMINTLDSNGDVGGYTSMAIDASGKAHISYYGLLK